METGDGLFRSEYADRKVELKRLAQSQRVPGLDPDDMHEELTVCLWRACQSYDPTSGTRFGQWWWSIWMNRKADLIDGYFRIKRIHPDPVDPAGLEDLVDALSPLLRQGDLVPPCPTRDRVGAAVWLLLALGYPGQEVRRLLVISRRQFDRTVQEWRTPEIRALLT